MSKSLLLKNIKYYLLIQNSHYNNYNTLKTIYVHTSVTIHSAYLLPSCEISNVIALKSKTFFDTIHEQRSEKTCLKNVSSL